MARNVSTVIADVARSSASCDQRGRSRWSHGIDREAPEAPRFTDREAPEAPRFLDGEEGMRIGQIGRAWGISAPASIKDSVTLVIIFD